MAVLFGVLVGLAVCIPPGPVNIVVISQAMKRGFLHGFAAGLLAAVLDGTYCLLAVLGMANIAEYLNAYQAVLKIIAFLILAGVAWRTFRQSRDYGRLGVSAPPAGASARPFFTVFLLYVSNPSLYAFWLGTAGFVTGHGYIASHKSVAYLFTASVFAGCVLWYLTPEPLRGQVSQALQAENFSAHLPGAGRPPDGFCPGHGRVHIHSAPHLVSRLANLFI